MAVPTNFIRGLSLLPYIILLQVDKNKGQQKRLIPLEINLLYTNR